MSFRWISLSVVLLSHAPAHAQAAELDSLHIENCDATFDDAVRGALEVELIGIGSSMRDALESGRVRSRLRCEPDVITIRVEDRDTEQVIVELIGIAEPALPRRVALTLSEIYAALASVARTAPRSTRAEPSADLADPVALDTLASRDPFELRVLGGLWIGGEPLLLLGSVELGASWPLEHFAKLMMGLGGAFGSVSIAAGALDVRVLSCGVSLRFGGNIGGLELGVGPAVRGGVVFWTGHPRDSAVAVGRDTWGPWLGLGGAAGAMVRIDGTPVRIGLDLEGGAIAVSHGATAEGVLAARLGSGWIDVRLAIAFAIP